MASLFFDWIAIVSVVSFAAMGIDKMLAAGGSSRIRERNLWLTALLGGFLGTLVGGFVFHHKTSKTGFWVPVAVSAMLWIVGLSLLTGAHLF